jgi:hyperosmotically inducible protein
MKRLAKITSSFMLILTLSACQMSGGMSGMMIDGSDESVSRRVQQALYLNDDPVIANLHAESIQGILVLTGFVKKIKQSDDAEIIARNTPGVREVKNNIIVRP